MFEFFVKKEATAQKSGATSPIHIYGCIQLQKFEFDSVSIAV
jgi:hypothetical protein